jgi:hypothetical protein
MDKLTQALSEVPADDLAAIIEEFAHRTEVYTNLDSPYAFVYAAIACAAIDAQR